MLDDIATEKLIIVIPAYNPDERLLRLVDEMRPLLRSPFIIVDDGSRRDAKWIFNKLESDFGCDVLRHACNLGKGAALKTAAKHIVITYPKSVGFVTVDADFQHMPKDILRVARTLIENPDSLVLGVRRFDGRDVPGKSKWGNQITSAVFDMQTGIQGLDTQTGLRGIPRQYAEACGQIQGERFEYEMNMLLQMAKENVPFIQIPIQTVYIEQNRSSSFRPLWDSVRIFWNILKFSGSSLVCAGIDLALFAFLRGFLFSADDTGIMISTVAARLISGICNFIINKSFVFKNKGNRAGAGLKYFALFVLLMLLSGAITSLLAGLGIPALVSKLFVDSSLFILSYIVQKKLIFKAKGDV
ncbi:MAG: bifunctional glycosyltransferase family 2/GtrA family protein [Clostridiales bacterium]|nr:bifunctional glycosyltransferase family 2/GtrA family protein [Clostridiales bacterium]